jgi:SNF family Na+-dependent transporter
MPVIFQSLPAGWLLGFMWFGLLFIAGITSSVAMATPIVAFFREEFGVRRETVTWSLGAIVFLLGLMHIAWLGKGFLDEWDFWAGTFGLVVFATLEVVLFMWVFGPKNAWASLHEGADIQLPGVFKFVMTFITPAFLLFLLGWWAVTDALPILFLEASAGGGDFDPANTTYVLLSRGLLVLMALVFTGLVAWAWKRNRYDDRVGFTEPETVL